MSSPIPAPVVSLRSIAPTVYLPAVLFGIGQGAIAPVVVLSARELGASVGTASLIVALIGIGQLLGDLPAGSFAARVGERRAMILSAGVIVVALTCCVFAGSVGLFGIAIGVMGLAGAVWGIARHTYLTEVVPYRLRARAMSTLGGSQRIGTFIGPFLGAATMHWWGTSSVYVVHLVSALAAAALVGFLPEPRAAESEQPIASTPDGPGTFRVLADHSRVFRTLGIGILAVGAVRASKQVVIPLWADHIGLDLTTTSVIFGLAGAVDMLLFYPAGKIMDRFGRVWVAVPCMAVMAIALTLLPLTGNGLSLLLVALLMSFGNGMGSGIVMTLGADASPEQGRAQFLGGWRLCADLGNAGGPMLISGITVAAALGPAILAMAVVGFAGAAAMARWVPGLVVPTVPAGPEPEPE